MNRAKAKGTSYETSLLPLLRQYYPQAERRALSGGQDKGDFVLPGARFVIEAKNRVQLSLSEWIKEAQVEAKNAGVPHGVIVHKRRGKTDPAEQWVTLRLVDFLELVKKK